MRAPITRSALLGLAVLVAACGGTGTYGKPAPVATAAPVASPAPSGNGYGTGGAPAAGTASVALADNALGTILVDGKGMTLYMFTADSAGKSACTGDCLANWPPLLSTAAPTLGAGLDAAGFATITRDDGGTQVTFHGMPLYSFAGDKAAGDANGQGVGSKWYVLKADGTVVK
jgi:predicted lipoprotein with Yx(FWY)xxD motif